MVVKVYISGISGNKEVKKRQQRVLMILESKNVKYEVIDIAEPGKEEAKEFMQNNSKSLGATIGDANPKHPLPPQVFSDDEYCGDYDMFDMANEVDEVEKFLKLSPSDVTEKVNEESKLKNGTLSVDEVEDTLINLNSEINKEDESIINEEKSHVEETIDEPKDKSEEKDVLKNETEEVLENGSTENTE